MAATADVSSVSAWSKATEVRRKPKVPGRYVFQPSTDDQQIAHSGSSEEDVDSLIDAYAQTTTS
eukprot:1948590-Amphidinium_carterae.1